MSNIKRLKRRGGNNEDYFNLMINNPLHGVINPGPSGVGYLLILHTGSDSLYAQ
jgi:hypothetical protein